MKRNIFRVNRQFHHCDKLELEFLFFTFYFSTVRNEKEDRNYLVKRSFSFLFLLLLCLLLLFLLFFSFIINIKNREYIYNRIIYRVCFFVNQLWFLSDAYIDRDWEREREFLMQISLYLSQVSFSSIFIIDLLMKTKREISIKSKD